MRKRGICVTFFPLLGEILVAAQCGENVTCGLSGRESGGFADHRSFGQGTSGKPCPHLLLVLTMVMRLVVSFNIDETTQSVLVPIFLNPHHLWAVKASELPFAVA